MYDKLVEWSGKTEWVRALALPAVVADALLELAIAVSEVAEDVIKGLANVLGGFIFNKCDFRRGVKQLLLCTPYDIVKHAVLLCLMPIDALSVLFFTIAPSGFNDKVDDIGVVLSRINPKWNKTTRGKLWWKEDRESIQGTQGAFVIFISNILARLLKFS